MKHILKIYFVSMWMLLVLVIGYIADSYNHCRLGSYFEYKKNSQYWVRSPYYIEQHDGGYIVSRVAPYIGVEHLIQYNPYELAFMPMDINTNMVIFSDSSRAKEALKYYMDNSDQTNKVPFDPITFSSTQIYNEVICSDDYYTYPYLLLYGLHAQ